MSKLEPLAQAVLDVRAAHPGASLADLYDPDTSRRISARPIGRWIGLWIGFIGA
ncbi:type IIL restriction-modification enzyme MmeI [Candidatus Synechococcus spongiarum]|uniref:type IIL restriction-modification enzyme MmeI n=1 Tax=Candidatus Synechococcus spongiarum TaxID=431041 RepID=UPI0030B842A3